MLTFLEFSHTSATQRLSVQSAKAAMESWFTDHGECDLVYFHLAVTHDAGAQSYSATILLAADC